MVTTNNDLNLIKRLQEGGDAKDVITFVVRNNFLEVRQNLYKLGYSVRSINNEEAAINAILQIYKAGYSIREILNVRYNVNAPNETSMLFMQNNSAGKLRIDWAALGTGALAVLMGYFGGQYADIATNSNNAPPPSPAETGDVAEGKINWLFYSIIAFGVVSLGVTAYGIAKRKRTFIYVGGAFLALTAGFGAYTYYINEVKNK